MEEKRPQFGNRFLTNPENVFAHNAWDDVTWDEELELEARGKVDKNSQKRVSGEMKEKYEVEANNFWDKFYSQHQNKFFKDRHWLFTEFPELSGSNTISSAIPERAGLSQSKTPDENQEQQTKTKTKTVDTSDPAEKVPRLESPSENDENSTSSSSFPGAKSSMRILEVGCGVGNTIFPVLQTNNDPGLFVYGCDLSTTAIDIVKTHTDYDARRCHAFVCDVTDPEQAFPFPERSLDLVVLIFVLSAVNPQKMQATIERLAAHLKPGGRMVLRDYGRYDLAQLRFKDGQCLDENFYVRGDGTRVYFFTQDELRDLFTSAGLVEEQSLVDRRLQVNRGRQLKMYRVWVQCKYRKPGTADSASNEHPREPGTADSVSNEPGSVDNVSNEHHKPGTADSVSSESGTVESDDIKAEGSNCKDGDTVVDAKVEDR